MHCSREHFELKYCISFMFCTIVFIRIVYAIYNDNEADTGKTN